MSVDVDDFGLNFNVNIKGKQKQRPEGVEQKLNGRNTNEKDIK